jgi:hypothetical protein
MSPWWWLLLGPLAWGIIAIPCAAMLGIFRHRGGHEG